MAGETDLTELIKGMRPKLNTGEFVFVSLENLDGINRNDTICEFKESEGITIVIAREKADELHLSYTFIAAWITLTIHSALDAVGLTAVFATELAKNNISANVIAGYYHDHIFVAVEDAAKVIHVLTEFSKSYKKTRRLFLDDIRTVEMVYDKFMVDQFDTVRNYDDFVAYIKKNGLPDFISFDNDLGLAEDGEIAADGYAAAKWLVYESGIDIRDLEFKIHSANPIAADQIRGLLNNYIKHLKKTK